MRLLFVHAHPDGESIWIGGLTAATARSGTSVSTVTYMIGEPGKVIGTLYRGLVADGADQLGGLHAVELHLALRVLGTNGPSNASCLLGGAGRRCDSSMVGDKGNGHPRVFANSGDEAVVQLRTTLDELQPDLVVTYDADGGYGYPGHICAHDITVAACGNRPPTLWVITDCGATAVGLDAITVVLEDWQACDVDGFAIVTDHFEAELDDAAVAAEVEAMRAHTIQMWSTDGSVSEANSNAVHGQTNGSGRAQATWAFSNLSRQPVMPTKVYRLGTVIAVFPEAPGGLVNIQLLPEPVASVDSVPSANLAAEGSMDDE